MLWRQMLRSNVLLWNKEFVAGRFADVFVGRQFDDFDPATRLDHERSWIAPSDGYQVLVHWNNDVLALKQTKSGVR